MLVKKIKSVPLWYKKDTLPWRLRKMQDKSNSNNSIDDRQFHSTKTNIEKNNKHPSYAIKKLIKNTENFVEAQIEKFYTSLDKIGKVECIENNKELNDQCSDYLKGFLSKDENVLIYLKSNWSVVYKPLLIGFFFCWKTIQNFLYMEKLQAAGDMRYLDEWDICMLFLIISLVSFTYAIVILCISEMIVTNVRVIKKSGIFNIRTQQMTFNQIESVEFKQNILERILRCGTISFSGTGASKIDFTGIDKAFQMKSKIDEILDKKI